MHLATIGINELREPVIMARAYIDETGIEKLTASIRALGLLQPLLVRERDGYYEVVDGHRRLLACRLVGLPAVRCLVRGPKDGSDQAAKINSNLWRQDMNPVEEAGFFSALLPDFGNDTDKLAKGLGFSRNYVESRLLLMQGDPDVLNAVAQHQLGLGVAAILNQITDKDQRDYYLGWAIRTGCTIETARQWLQIADAAAMQPALAPGIIPTPQIPVPPSRDIFQCFLCGENEPKVGLEFWHIHGSCRYRMERAAQVLGIDLEGPLLPQLEMLAAQMRNLERAKPAAEVKA
jgi:ParB/RepB/Spo0J family partition protein